MLRLSGHTTPFLALALVSTACTNLSSTTDIQVAKMDEMKSSYGKYFTYMVDNAILSDMSVADVHFVPHHSELNGIGAARLERMADLLNAYGGVVRYETTSKDEALIAQRIKHVREFLVLVGCESDDFEVAVLPAGGRGMPGQEAVEKYRQSTNAPANGAPAGGVMSLTSDQ